MTEKLIRNWEVNDATGNLKIATGKVGGKNNNQLNRYCRVFLRSLDKILPGSGQDHPVCIRRGYWFRTRRRGFRKGSRVNTDYRTIGESCVCIYNQLLGSRLEQVQLWLIFHIEKNFKNGYTRSLLGHFQVQWIAISAPEIRPSHQPEPHRTRAGSETYGCTCFDLLCPPNAPDIYVRLVSVSGHEW